MDKLKMRTPNRADDNSKKLAALFPNAVTETINENGEVVRAIDNDALMQEISCAAVDGKDERYQFTWPDKKKSVLLANAPISKTLRPCREESVEFDNTENLYIDGELDREATYKKFLLVRTEGTRQVKRNIDHFNLDTRTC